MITATRFGHQPQARFAGLPTDDEKAEALRRAHQASEDAQARLTEAQERWGKVTPAQKAGIKGVVGLILLAVAAGNKKNSMLRTIALLGAAGLLGSAGMDMARLGKMSRLLPQTLGFESAPEMSSKQAIIELKAEREEESKRLEGQLEKGKLDLEGKVRARMRLIEIAAVQAELDEQLARLELNA